MAEGIITLEAPPARGWWYEAARRLLRHRPAAVGLIVLGAFGLVALFAPWVDRHDPEHQYLYVERDGEPVVDETGRRVLAEDTTLAGPSPRFWLGTDRLARDQYSRLVHGARISLAVGVFSQAIALAVGVAVGMAAGLGGRWADRLLMRLADIAYSFPDLLMLILLVSVFGSSLALVVFAIAAVSWPTIARLVRGQVLALREEEFVVAARALGAGGWRIGWHHLLPNLLGPVIVTATFGIPTAIFAEAALSFIGLGLQAPSWGRLVTDAFDTIFVAPHLVVTSCLAVALTMMSFTFLGDGLRDALDPRSRTAQRLPEPPVSVARTAGRRAA